MTLMKTQEYLCLTSEYCFIQGYSYREKVLHLCLKNKCCHVLYFFNEFYVKTNYKLTTNKYCLCILNLHTVIPDEVN